VSAGNGTAPPARPNLADPASQPRHSLTGRQERGKPVFAESAGVSTSDLAYWEVEVTPLEAASNAGRNVGTPAEAMKRGVVFEVRALYYGTGLPEFGSQPNTRLVPQTWEEDLSLAIAVAKRFADLLRSGAREGLDLLQLAAEMKARRG